MVGDLGLMRPSPQHDGNSVGKRKRFVSTSSVSHLNSEHDVDIPPIPNLRGELIYELTQSDDMGCVGDWFQEHANLLHNNCGMLLQNSNDTAGRRCALPDEAERRNLMQSVLTWFYVS